MGAREDVEFVFTMKEISGIIQASFDLGVKRLKGTNPHIASKAKLLTEVSIIKSKGKRVNYDEPECSNNRVG